MLSSYKIRTEIKKKKKRKIDRTFQINCRKKKENKSKSLVLKISNFKSFTNRCYCT